ncbi:hypothetical protein ABIA45_007489 [Bradyrhizobium sp. USDA 336]
MHEPEGYDTKLKTRWPTGIRSGAEFLMPTMKTDKDRGSAILAARVAAFATKCPAVGSEMVSLRDVSACQKRGLRFTTCRRSDKPSFAASSFYDCRSHAPEFRSGRPFLHSRIRRELPRLRILNRRCAKKIGFAVGIVLPLAFTANTTQIEKVNAIISGCRCALSVKQFSICLRSMPAVKSKGTTAASIQRLNAQNRHRSRAIVSQSGQAGRLRSTCHRSTRQAGQTRRNW